jgi:integrase
MSSIRKTKAGKFEVRIWSQGKRFSKTFQTLLRAEHWASGVTCGEIKPQSTLKKTGSSLEVHSNATIAECLERYLNEVVINQRGVIQATHRVRQLQGEPFATKRLHECSADDIRALKSRELERGCSGATVSRKMAVLSSMYSHAIQEWGVSTINPVRLVRKPPPAKPRVRRLSVQDQERLLSGCRSTRTPYLKEVIEIALETGCRKGELLALGWENVDLARRILHLDQTKNGHQRYVPLTDKAIVAVTALKAAGTVTVVPISRSALENAWKRLVRRCALQGLRFHDLRHEALSRWADRLGGDVFKLSLISGHKTLSMANRYTHPSLSELLARLGDKTLSD